jgi:hypothetical protein
MQGNHKKPGQVIQVPRFSVTWSFVAALSVIFLTALYYWGDQRRQDTLEFFIWASGVCGGLLSAYYVWEGLKTTVAQREELRKERSIDEALTFICRWNDPGLARTRERWRKLGREIAESNVQNLPEFVAADMERRTVVADVLNFYEEMAYAARRGTADITTLRELFDTVVLDYYETYRPWVAHRRKADGKPTAWEHLEWLYDQWKR